MKRILAAVAALVATSAALPSAYADDLSITPATLPDATQQVYYAQSFTATGGSGSYNWSVVPWSYETAEPTYSVGGVSVSGSSQLVDDGEGWKVTLYAPPKATAKPPFEGWCETLPVALTLDEQMVVLEVAVGSTGDGGSND